jgi:hypothetical protein
MKECGNNKIHTNSKLIFVTIHTLRFFCGGLQCYFLWGYAVAQLVEEVLYKPGVRRFNSQICHWNFLLSLFFRPHWNSGTYSFSDIHEYQSCFLGGKGGRCLELTTVPHSCSDFLRNSRTLILMETSGPVEACIGIASSYNVSSHVYVCR